MEPGTIAACNTAIKVEFENNFFIFVNILNVTVEISFTKDRITFTFVRIFPVSTLLTGYGTEDSKKY